MNSDDRMVSSSVGTRGGVEWMRGPCACPRRNATMLLHGTPGESRCHQDKHKAPTLPPIRPLSLQDGSGCFPSLPHSVGKIHQDGATRITAFGRQNSSGRRGLKRPDEHNYPIRLSKFIRTEPRILPILVVNVHQANCHSPQYNSTLPKRTRSPTLTPASSNALVTPIFERVTCRRSMLSSLSWLVMLTVRSTRLPRTI